MRSEPKAPQAPTGRTGGAPRRLAGLAAAALLALGLASTGQAALTPTSNAIDVARAIADHPAFVVGAEFEVAPPNGTSAAVSTDQLAGFWTSPETPDFAILSTGNAANVVPDADLGQAARAGDDLGGGPFHDGNQHDVTILRIDIQVPQRAECMQFDYRFLTDESASGQPPTGPFDDAFVARLDSPPWLVDGDGNITLPGSEETFATTPARKPVSVKNLDLFLSPAGAFGTAFDRATPIWQAWAPVRAGERHSLYLMTRDSVDPERDSAVFIDHLTFGTDDGGTSCTPGPTLVTRMFADQPQSLIGGANGYRILVEAVGGPLPGAGGALNAPIDPSAVTSITSSLAPGFAYVPRSTSGGTRNEPSIQGHGRLTWAGPFAATTTLPEDSIELRFGVFLPSKPGTYTTEASVDQDSDKGYFLLPSGPSAPIDVVPPAADLQLAHAQSPTPATLDQRVELALIVTNHGPQPASGVVLDAKLPASLGKPKVSSTQGACTLDGSLVCKLGRLLPSTGATVTVAGVLTGAELSLAANVTGVELDTDLSNNGLAANAAVVAAVTDPIIPVVGDTLATEAKKGKVTVKPPDGSSFIELHAATAIPVGTTIDARKGEVKITTADKDGEVQAARFARGKFVVRQQKTGLTTLNLLGGDFSQCRSRAKGDEAGRETQRFIKDGARGRRVIRRLWGRGRGKFRTRGRYAAATVRGTVWRTIDRCDGTLIRVRRGVVIVRDVRRKRAVKVRAGQEHLVKRPAGKKAVA